VDHDLFRALAQPASSHPSTPVDIIRSAGNDSFSEIQSMDVMNDEHVVFC
jgi:hypothetical protein